MIFSIISLVLYSRYISTDGLRVKEYKVMDSELTDNFHGLKIVHISDLHYGTTFNYKNLVKVLDKIKNIKPDIVVLTGDLFDSKVKLNDNKKQKLVKLLSSIDTTIGKYAISGEDDIDLDWDQIIKESDFTNLNDDYTSIYDNGSNYIFMGGISSNKKSDTKIANYLKTLKDDDKPVYNILLIHKPDYISNFDYAKYDLILAGHCHGGQIRLPFVGPLLLPKGAKNYNNEHYLLNNTNLYISYGLGTSDVYFRFLNKPSINFYRLTNK